jgi:transcriptional regulator with XRE-family HTH domain
MQIMNMEGMTSARFAEEIGIQRAAVSHIFSGRNNPSLDVYMKILERFPYINPDWLLFGSGNMKREYTSGNQQKQLDLFSSPAHIPDEKKAIPENRQEIRDKKPVQTIKSTETENITLQEVPVKKVLKIMIFYTDNTYEMFNPEKTSQH